MTGGHRIKGKNSDLNVPFFKIFTQEYAFLLIFWERKVVGEERERQKKKQRNRETSIGCAPTMEETSNQATGQDCPLDCYKVWYHFI